MPESEPVVFVMLALEALCAFVTLVGGQPPGPELRKGRAVHVGKKERRWLHGPGRFLDGTGPQRASRLHLRLANESKN